MRQLGRDSYTHKKLENYKRWKKQRIRQGFATRDLWNMDNWLCNVIPDALDKLMLASMLMKKIDEAISFSKIEENINCIPPSSIPGVFQP